MGKSKEQSKPEGQKIVIYYDRDEFLICALGDEKQLKKHWFQGPDGDPDRCLEDYSRDVVKLGTENVLHIRTLPYQLDHGVHKITEPV
jgi:hypothetical protein